MKVFFLSLTTVILILGVMATFQGFVTGEDKKTTLCFVISARKLPDTDSMGMGSPDGYVEIEYMASPSAKAQITNTSRLNNDHNPDWPEVFHIVYHPSQGQLLTFTVLDHNRISDDKKIGSVSISVGEMVKTPKQRLEMELVGPKKDAGKLLLFMKVDEKLYEDTERRLRNKNAKMIHIGGHYQYVD